jgi:hypothetical protein
MKHRARSMHTLMQSLAAQSAADKGGRGGGMLSCMLDNTARGKAELNKAMGKSLVQCYLNVTSVLLCKDGLVCMAI